MAKIAKYSVLAWAAAVSFVLPAAPGAFASGVLAPAVGAPDSIMNGATVADPRTPSSAAFANPAALVVLPDGMQSMSIGIGMGNSEIDASYPPTYSDSDHPLALIPEFGLAVRGNGPWSYGFAAYGSVGMAYRFDADPASGVPGSFKSELSVISLAPVVAYQVNEQLSLGASITPLFGQLRIRYTVPTGEGDILRRYKVGGPGVQGIVGLRWAPGDDIAFGLGVRLPGLIWMDGSAALPDGTRADMNLDLKMPMQIFVGVNGKVGDSWALGIAGRWTDMSSFSRSLITTEGPDLPEHAGAFSDRPMITDANDEWRISAGAEYSASDLLSLYAGVGYADSIVGNRGVSPLIYDGQDIKASIGVGLHLRSCTVDFGYGRMFEDQRTISGDEALLFPGEYRGAGHIVFIGLRMQG